MEVYRFDVVVAGGGVTGVCAAITAARAGMRTALIQNRPVLGGNSSSEIRVWTRGSIGGGTLYSEEMGVLGELKLHNLRINPEFNPVLWDEALLDKVLAEPNITLYLNTNITDVQMQSPQRINAIIANQLATELQLKICGKVFIDATGDGTVGYFANAPYREGREGRAEFGEALGVDRKDNCREGSTILFLSKDEGRPIRFVKPNYAYDLAYIEKLLDRGGRIVNETMNGCDYWWLEYGGTEDTIRGNQMITLELKRLLMGIWNYIKNSGRFDAGNLTLEWVGNLSGKRESRRFVGEYTLTQSDLENDAAFEDAVCSGGRFMDFHPERGIYTEEAFCTQVPVHAYQIPMGCFYNNGLQNLIFSGRNISASHVAFSSTRIMDTCGLTGQAAGEIAACCVEHACTPGTVREKHLIKLQQELLKNDMSLWDLKNNDPNDLAPMAAVSCSGSRRLENKKADGELALEGEAFLALPHTQVPEALDLEIACTGNTVLECVMYASRLSSRKVNGERICGFQINLVKGQPFVRLNLKKAPENQYLKIVFADNPAVKIKTSRQSLTGFLAGHKESPYYKTPCISADDSRTYHCTNVINGYHRLQRGCNLWISESLDKEQWFKFTWKREVVVSQVRLYLNPDLSMELPSSISKIANEHHGFARREGEPRELLKAFTIFAKRDGRWEEVAKIEDNYQRLCVVNFTPVRTMQLKLLCRETYGSPYAEVFETRIY